MTEAQKFHSDVEMKETYMGWTVKHVEDFNKLFDLLNENSIDREDSPQKTERDYADDVSTHYIFSDGSKIIEQYNEKQEKVFNYYI